VLGAGIMGCSLAMFLARRGADVTLIDEADAPFARTSRWNEGKFTLAVCMPAIHRSRPLARC
jgi:glycine/D-amino acid oxidase-like deaminating enzyme